MIVSLVYNGDGRLLASSGYHANRLDAAFGVGEIVLFETTSQRSAQSHKHYFSVIADAWANLPESIAADYPSPEHLRKRALIKAGYCDMANIILPDNKAAIAACALMQTMDTYALCNVSERVVTVWRAHSQSMKAMGNKTFQESKNRTLDVISQLIGADATQGAQAA